MPFPPPPTHQRNHTSRIGRVIAAAEEYRAQYALLLSELDKNLKDPQRNPVALVHQRIAEYELNHGEKPDDYLLEAIYNLIDRYNGFRDNVIEYAPSREAEAVIVEERTMWAATHKRNEYNANAQARRRAKISGQREVYEDDANEYERRAQPAELQPLTDEELARGDWKHPPVVAQQREVKEVHRQQQIEVQPQSQNVGPVDDERAQYERERAERQRQEAELLATRQGSPLVGKIKP